MVGVAALRDGPKGRVPEIRNAYRYLNGAHRSVEGLFAGANHLIDARRLANPTAQGRLHTDEVNVLRAAIVFTSSGLDASMKRLVNDAGRYLITRPSLPGKPVTGARAEFEQYLKMQLSAQKVDQSLKEAITAEDATTRIIDYYLAMRSKASFQGSGDLERRVRTTLGIAKSRITDAQLRALDPFFVARNRIAHSMDYTNVETSKSTAREHRTIDSAAALCDQAFAVGADLIHAAADVILAAR